MTEWQDIETRLRKLMKGEFASLTLSFNDGPAPNYMKVDEYILSGWGEGQDWVSEDEKRKGAETNSMWTLHWYPDTPVGFYSMSASTLEALFAGVDAEFPPPPNTGADR